MLGIAMFTPIFGAVLIGWIFSVCVHEFAHAVVAYWGGDRSVRDRGYLSFDPLTYIHPVTSILVPIVILVMGGLPLPGGAVMIDRASLRSRHWRALVSAAGPAANVLLFILLAVILHPSTGLVDPTAGEQPTWVTLVGALATLEMISVFLNLIPIPPLDGFGIIEPYLSPELARKARSIGWAGLVVLFLVLMRVDAAMRGLMGLVDVVFDALGLPWEVTWRQFNLALFGNSE